MGLRFWLVTLPLLMILVLLALANRHVAELKFDPFSPSDPAIAFSMPTFFLVFLVFLAGFFVGGAAMWFTAGALRRKARQRARDIKKLKREATVINKQSGPKLPMVRRAG